MPVIIQRHGNVIDHRGPNNNHGVLNNVTRFNNKLRVIESVECPNAKFGALKHENGP